MHSLRSQRRRRGSNAIEFALILPVLMAFLTGIMDYGWFFSQQISMIHAVRDGVRAGATTAQEDNPVAVCESRIQESLMTAGFSGTVAMDVKLVGTRPDQALYAAVSTTYDPLVGFVPTPDFVGSSLTMRVEDQPDP